MASRNFRPNIVVENTEAFDEVQPWNIKLKRVAYQDNVFKWHAQLTCAKLQREQSANPDVLELDVSTLMTSSESLEEDAASTCILETSN